MVNNATVTTFNPLQFARKLQEAGFTEAQAEVIFEGISAARSNSDAVSQAEYREDKAKAEKRESDVLHAIADLRKDMELMKVTIEKWILRSTVGLGFLILAGPSPINTLLRLFR